MLSFKSILHGLLSQFIFSFDGGLGESMLLGSALATGKDLITGKGFNPLSSVLGGVTGGITGGFTPLDTAAVDAGGVLGQMAPEGLTSAGALDLATSPVTTGIESLAPGVGGYAGFGAPAADVVFDPMAGKYLSGALSSDIPTGLATTAADAASQAATSPGMWDTVKDTAYGAENWVKAHPLLAGAGGLGALALMTPKRKVPNIKGPNVPQFGLAGNYQPLGNPTPVYMAEGGIAALAGGGDPINFMGDDMYPQSQQQRSFYATPSQMPTSAQQAMASYEPNTNPLTGQPVAHMAEGGIANLGSYSDGGQLLKGPGDGMSDNIPASIGAKQPARLADGEFVVPADVVSHLGNGSTDAGAKRLYDMMDKVRKARTGHSKQGKEIKADKYLPS